MQALGFLGETALLLALPAGHAALVATAQRFIAFDGAGLALLGLALALTARRRRALSAA